MTEPMSEERLAEIDYCFSQLYFIDNSTAQSLLSEVHRLRDVPPEVSEAMEDYSRGCCMDSNAPIIAAHFTALFQKET